MAVDLSNKKAIVIDIEGTTTSISFVKDTLFPYVREHLEEFITSKWDTLQETRQLLKDQAKKDIEDKLEGAVLIEDGDEEKSTLIKNVHWQMDHDRKTAALKTLQGLIWEQGYDKGVIKGHLYPDVADALRDWKSASRSLYVYSSGSVDAQRLLFKHSASGNLLDLFDGHFDCNIGPKIEKESYAKIVKEVGSAPEEILFLTDVPKEADAARSAGMEVAIVVRDGNAPLPPDVAYPTIETFCEINVQPAAKRAKRDPEESSDVAAVAETEEKMEVAVASKTVEPEPESMETEAAEPTKEAEVTETPKEVTIEASTEAEIEKGATETPKAGNGQEEKSVEASTETETEKGATVTPKAGNGLEEKSEEGCEKLKDVTEAVNVDDKSAGAKGEAEKVEESKPEAMEKVTEEENQEVNGKVPESASKDLNGKAPESDIKDLNGKAPESETKDLNGKVAEAESKEVNGASESEKKEENGKVEASTEKNGTREAEEISAEETKENGCKATNDDAAAAIAAKKEEIAANGAENGDVKAKTVEVATPVVEVAAE